MKKVPLRGLTVISTLMILFFASGQTASGQELPATDLPQAAAPVRPIDDIIAGVENRYAGPAFSARFAQETTIRDMDISDVARGRVWMQRPGHMRWEYDAPEHQIFVSDGKTLWIHKPADNQVMIGRAPAFFGDGKGAAFLTDMARIRETFVIAAGGPDTAESHALLLFPREKNAEISSIGLTIDRDSHEVLSVVTLNAYGDETRIRLSDYRFEETPDEGRFRFEIPPGADVVTLDQ